MLSWAKTMFFWMIWRRELETRIGDPLGGVPENWNDDAELA